MKFVCLVRHAKAEKIKSDDFRRKLTNEGILEAELLGKSLKNDDFLCDLVISSNASRALETAVIIAETQNIKQRKIRVENSLYQGTGIDTYYRLLKELDNSINTVLISGHNTTLDAAAKDMCQEYDRRLTTAAAFCIAFNISNWNEITSGTGTACFYKFNKNKNKLADDEKRFIENLKNETTLKIENIFTDINKTIMFNDRKNTINSIFKSTEEIFKNSTIVTIQDLTILRNNTGIKNE